MDYLDFVPAIATRGQIKTFIDSDSGIQQQEGKLMTVFAAWWQLHAPGLGELPKTKRVMELRAEFLSSFVDSLEPVGLLDRFKVAGVVASWWDEVKYELRTLSESDFGGLVDSWVDTIKDALEQDDETQKNQTKFDPLNHKLVVRLMPDYLEEIAEAEARIAELEQQKEAFERGEEAEAVSEADAPFGAAEGEATEEESEAVNFAKELETRQKILKGSIKEPKKEIKDLKKNSPLLNAAKIAELEAMVEPREAEIAEIEKQLEPYKEIKKQLAQAKGILRTLKNELVKRLSAKRAALTDEECQGLVLAIFKDGLTAELERYVTAHRQQVIVAVENWWDKYRVTLQDIESERDAASQRLSEFLHSLGYTN
jgi:type I restriction enzyme M protein